MFPVSQNCLCSPVFFSFRLLFPCSPEINGLIPLFNKPPWRASFLCDYQKGCFVKSHLLYSTCHNVYFCLVMKGNLEENSSVRNTSFLFSFVTEWTVVTVYDNCNGKKIVTSRWHFGRLNVYVSDHFTLFQ